MSSRVFRRRSATAAWIYASVACGIAGTIVAARVLGRDDFGVFATALVVVGFFQILLDLTVEESLTKYGFRYVAGQDWGRLRRLFRQALVLKVAGGALATIFVVGLAPFSDELFGSDGVEQALLAAALLPFVQSSENVASTVLLLHSRYDLRGVYQAGSAALRLAAVVIAAPLGVTEALVAIVVAQGIATVAISFVGLVALRRFPAGPARELAEDVPGIRSFVIESSIATGVISMRTTLVPPTSTRQATSNVGGASAFATSSGSGKKRSIVLEEASGTATRGMPPVLVCAHAGAICFPSGSCTLCWRASTEMGSVPSLEIAIRRWATFDFSPFADFASEIPNEATRTLPRPAVPPDSA